MHTAIERPRVSPMRRRMLAAVHIARKQVSRCPVCGALRVGTHCADCNVELLDLSDEHYRAILTEATGKDSCTRMTDAELRRVLDVFEQAGWKSEKRRHPEQVAAVTRFAMGEQIEREAKRIMGQAWERRLGGYIWKRWDVPKVGLLTYAQLQSTWAYLRRVERAGQSQTGAEAPQGDEHGTDHSA